MKTLGAKPFDQNAENWKRENLLFTSTVLEADALGQNQIGTHALRSLRTVWFVFAAENSCFLLETGIAGHEMLLLAKWHPVPKKNCENGGFSTPLTGMKSCTVDRSCMPAPKGATKLAVFFRFFSSRSFNISIKNSVQRWSSDFQGLFHVKIGKWLREAMISPRSP